MRYKIIHADAADLLLVTTEGQMNSRDFIAMARSLLEHPDCIPGTNVIFDHTALIFDRVSVGELEEIRAFHMENDEKIGSGKSAIIVKAGLSGAWHQLWAQGQKIKAKNKVRVFEDYALALEWVQENSQSY